MTLAVNFLIILFCFSTVSAVNVLDQLVRAYNAKAMATPSKGSVKNNYFNCNIERFNELQSDFNKALNISTDLTWKQADTLFNLIDNKLGESVQSYIDVCEQQKKVYYELEETYSDCVNPMFLMSQVDNKNSYTQMFVYSSIWNELDFMCNGGFEIGIKSYKDIKAVYSTNAYKQCIQTFYDNMFNNFNEYCNSVNTFATCVQKAYIPQVVMPENEWWLCERIRQGYAFKCPSVRCYVSTI